MVLIAQPRAVKVKVKRATLACFHVDLAVRPRSQYLGLAAGGGEEVSKYGATPTK